MPSLQFISCPSNTPERLTPAVMRAAGVEPRHIYSSVENILALVQAAKVEQPNSPVVLPFCHTVEAKALGADIRPADDTAGPRPGSYTRTSLQPFSSVEIAKTADAMRLLKACKILSQKGERVVYQLSGPVSILSCLMDLTVVFKTWRKSPGDIIGVLQTLRQMLLAYCVELKKAGVSYIAYADPTGAPQLLGAHYTQLLTVHFTVPLLQELAAECKKQVSIILCPLTTASLRQPQDIAQELEKEGKLICSCIKHFG